MTDELITVVMSAYNAETTIERAIRSVLKQTYKNFELIIVDDASTDATRAMIEKVLVKDKRVRLVSKKENEGAGLARRNGIKARSENSRYLCFLDADDYLDKSYLETLYTAAKQYNADIVSAGMNLINGSQTAQEMPPKVFYMENDGHGMQWVDEKNPTAVYFRFLNLALLRSSLWQRVEYSARRFLEDTPTMVKLLYYANSRVMIPYAGYNYVQNPQSLCHTTNETKRLVYTILSAAESTEFYQQHGADATTFRSATFQLLKQLKDKGLSKEERQTYQSELAEIAVYLINSIQ